MEIVSENQASLGDLQKNTNSAALENGLIKQVTEAFSVFDAENTGAVDVREVGTIIRSLGLFLG